MDLRKVLTVVDEIAAEGAIEVGVATRERGGDGRIVLGSLLISSPTIVEGGVSTLVDDADARKGSVPLKIDDASSSEVSMDTIRPCLRGKVFELGGQGKARMRVVVSCIGLGGKRSTACSDCLDESSGRKSTRREFNFLESERLLIRVNDERERVKNEAEYSAYCWVKVHNSPEDKMARTRR